MCTVHLDPRANVRVFAVDMQRGTHALDCLLMVRQFAASKSQNMRQTTVRLKSRLIKVEFLNEPSQTQPQKLQILLLL